MHNCLNVCYLSGTNFKHLQSHAISVSSQYWSCNMRDISKIKYHCRPLTNINNQSCVTYSRRHLAPALHEAEQDSVRLTMLKQLLLLNPGTKATNKPPKVNKCNLSKKTCLERNISWRNVQWLMFYGRSIISWTRKQYPTWHIMYRSDSLQTMSVSVYGSGLEMAKE